MATHIPPLALVVAGLGAQHLLAKSDRPIHAGQRVAAIALGAVSVGFIATSVRQFRRSRTTVSPLSPDQATSLVTTGPHRLSRNPMYVGMAGVLSAHALSRGSVAAVLPVLGFVAVIDRRQIPAEEVALSTRFGPAYTAYQARVPRWLGLPRHP